MEKPRDWKVLSGGRPQSDVPITQRDDDELVLLFRGDAREAFDVLVRRHQSFVLGLAFKLLGSEDAAREAAQDAFVDLLRALPAYRPQGKFRHFLCRVAINRCRMKRRSTRNERRALESIARQPEPLPADLLIARERQRDMASALGQLRETQRELLTLRFYADLSHAEIAQVLRVPVGTVKSRLHAALIELRRVATQAGDP